MTTQPDHDGDARLRGEALELLVHLRSGRATTDDAARFLAWRATSAAHERAFRAAMRLQAQVRAVEQAGEAPVVPPPWRARAMTRRGMIRGALAASGAGALLLAGQKVDLIPTAAAMRADIRTRAGERRTVALAGDAQVTLNTRTSIAIGEDGARARVELIAGELLLDAPRPVTLTAGAGQTLAQGRVNLRRDGDAVGVTCLSGRAAVTCGATRHLLHAGQVLRYDDDGAGQVRDDADTAATVAWRSGVLLFRDLPFAQVVAEINRYRPGHVFVTSPALGARRLTGTFHVGRLDDFFAQARLAFGARVTHLPGGIVLLA